MGDSTRESVELFAKVAPGESWECQRQFFPSKLGGHPAWLEPEKLPPEAAFACRGCAGVMSFVLQLYAPDDDEPSGDAFHRALFLFACQPCGTQWRAYRSQLPRANRHYSDHPEPPGTNFPQPGAAVARQCCPACWIPSSGEAAEGDVVAGSSKVCDVTEEGGGLAEWWENGGTGWRALHPRCKVATRHQTLEATFPEALLLICEGDIQEPDNHLAHERELYRRYQEMRAAGGGEEELDESEEKAIESIQQERLVVDRSFERFCKRTTPSEVLYYCRDGTPLWTSDRAPRLRCAEAGESAGGGGVVPACERCGGPRSFEFQVLPQMHSHLRAARLDFASVVVYTCAASCRLAGEYQQEFVYVEQDLSLAAR
ncbi:programmed cell death protein 2 [Babesia caballi]|uniref:Programmed cell death protein 2 n=1 Tax=Babesia caballi TaxID=5871 RepID=A0AAV4M027_BABCB|nr:programmed cell death protein 2 [Babesia caballi]